MRIQETKFDDIKRFAGRASKERVAIKPTQNTMWFALSLNEVTVGCCALYLGKKKCRIKGDFILEQYRGRGLGKLSVESRLETAKKLGYKMIEVYTLHPKYYTSLGFTIHKELRKGVWIADYELI